MPPAQDHGWQDTCVLSHGLGLVLQAVENAIREGIIYWHAFPYNGQLELMDERHVRESVPLTHELDVSIQRDMLLMCKNDETR